MANSATTASASPKEKLTSEALLRSLLSTPAPGSAVPHRTALAASQQSALYSLIEHFSSPSLTLPTSLPSKDNLSAEEVKEEPLTEWEKCSTLSEEALLRCLRADKWDLEKARMRAAETVVWRRGFGLATLEISHHLETVKHEGATGKAFILGFDKECRPLFHMRPRFQNTPVNPGRLINVFWTFDRAADLMPNGQDKLTLMIDLSGDGEKPALKHQMEFLHNLSTYYCERLGKAVILNMPTFYTWIIKMLKPFIEPVTYAKIVFDRKEGMGLVPPEQRDATLEGTSGYEWDGEAYFAVVVEVCEARRRAKLQRWRERGAKVGLSEWDEEPFSASDSNDEKQATGVKSGSLGESDETDVDEKVSEDGKVKVNCAVPESTPALIAVRA